MDLHNVILDINYIKVELLGVLDDVRLGVDSGDVCSRVESLFNFSSRFEDSLVKAYNKGGKIE